MIVFFDTNIYNKLAGDSSCREQIARLIASGIVRVVTTPMVVDEVEAGPLKRLPNWFPINVEAENVAVIGYARIGMSRLGDGTVYKAHRGVSKKTPDAIIADSADALADILVSDDNRSRNKLSRISPTCRGMTYAEFCAWLDQH